MSKLKTRKLTIFVASLVVLFVLYSAYGSYRESVAKPQAMEFCASIKVGDPADGLLERAVTSGADEHASRWRGLPVDGRTLTAVFVGLPPFSRHICSVKATDKVVSAEYIYLD